MRRSRFGIGKVRHWQPRAKLPKLVYGLTLTPQRCECRKLCPRLVNDWRVSDNLPITCEGGSTETSSSDLHYFGLCMTFYSAILMSGGMRVMEDDVMGMSVHARISGDESLSDLGMLLVTTMMMQLAGLGSLQVQLLGCSHQTSSGTLEWMVLS